jgi:hypothetical protein
MPLSMPVTAEFSSVFGSAKVRVVPTIKMTVAILKSCDAKAVNASGAPGADPDVYALTPM